MVEEFGGADVYMWYLGVVDYYVMSDEYVLVIVCLVVCNLYCVLKDVFWDFVLVEELVVDLFELFGLILEDYW